MKRLITTLALAAGASACTPVVRGEPALDLSPGLATTSHVTSVVLSTNWLRTEEDFAVTFSEEVMEELSLCANGPHPLHLRVHVEDMDRAGRLETLVTGDEVHRLTATAELIDPARGDLIVGRYPLEIAVGAGGPVAGLLSDRQMMMSEGFARALCEAAFARNPRRPGPRNATPD